MMGTQPTSRESIRKGAVGRLFGLALAIAASCGPADQRTDAEAPPVDAPPEALDRPGSKPGEEAGPDTPAAARLVVRDYYAALAAGDHARAYGYWVDEDVAAGRTPEGLRPGLAETVRAEADVGTPGRVDPAAGSRYVRVPVAVLFETPGGEARCFRGTHTLRRAEVPGATDEQRRWRIASADVERLPPALCAHGVAGDPGGAAAVVEAFGRRLASISLLAPSDVVVRDIEERYAPYVTAALLEAWLQDPSGAPGREVSSPWPGRIEVREVERVSDDVYRVTGEVVYLTSVESERGGAADRRPVVMDVVPDGGWRIAAYEES